ncbi:MAG: tRNA (adenosine(37)-N6)-threonylcarbamoyltransferase complex dimerization subunit type 1 TsaB [Anaerolineales bacterium]
MGQFALGGRDAARFALRSPRGALRTDAASFPSNDFRGLSVLLTLDTATRMIGIALHDGENLLAESLWLGGRRHTVLLAPEVALMLRKINRTADALTAVAVTSGPGSYTGLRIGIAYAKGLALSHQLPLIGIPTLDVLARGQPKRSEPMLAVIEAGRKRVVGMWYKWGRSGWKPRGEAGNYSWKEVISQLEKKSYVCGEISTEARKKLKELSNVRLASPADCVRRPGILAELAWERIQKGKLPDIAAVRPVYLDSGIESR